MTFFGINKLISFLKKTYICSSKIQKVKEVVLSLGSNLGDRGQYLSSAIELINSEVGRIVKKSSVYETPSWGFESNDFLNQVIVIKTSVKPLKLLDIIQQIEKKLGRDNKSKIINGVPQYHARTIDIDILIYGSEKIESERLTIPHPRMRERDFVMTPLRELKIAN